MLYRLRHYRKGRTQRHASLGQIGIGVAWRIDVEVGRRWGTRVSVCPQGLTPISYEGNVSHGMRQVNGLSTQSYNRRHGQGGHVFQGRYKAIVVERDSYLFVLCRSIVLNPIRAGMVRTAQEYGWSSYRATAGGCAGGALLCTDWIVAPCSGERAEAQLRYRHCVDEGVTYPAPWEALQGQILLGPTTFVEGLRPRLTAMRRLHEVPRVQRYADRPSLTTLVRNSQALTKAARDRLISTAHVDYGYSLSAIGRAVGLHYTTMSKVVKAQMG